MSAYAVFNKQKVSDFIIMLSLCSIFALSNNQNDIN